MRNSVRAISEGLPHPSGLLIINGEVQSRALGVFNFRSKAVTQHQKILVRHIIEELKINDLLGLSGYSARTLFLSLRNHMPEGALMRYIVDFHTTLVARGRRGLSDMPPINPVTELDNITHLTKKGIKVMNWINGV